MELCSALYKALDAKRCRDVNFYMIGTKVNDFGKYVFFNAWRIIGSDSRTLIYYHAYDIQDQPLGQTFLTTLMPSN